MKKIISLFSLIMTVTSCTNNDDVSKIQDTSILPKKIIYTEGANSSTLTLSYNGNKIKETTNNNGYKSVYTYTGDLITNVTNYKGTAIDYISDYTYENEILKSQLNIHFSPNTTDTYKLKSLYTHNADGNILEERYSIDSKTGKETKNGNSEIYTFENGNLTKQVSKNTYTYFDGTKSLTTTYEYTYINEYDNKNNPSMNILGLNKIEFSDTSSKNNIIKVTATNKTNGVATPNSTYITNYTISYDSFGFLTDQIYSYIDENKTVIKKNQYFYN